MGRELPILFNTDMVCSVLYDLKKATRRTVKQSVWENFVCEGGKVIYYLDNKTGSLKSPLYKAPYQVGDILYVREAWHKDVRRYMYRADYDDNEKFYRNGKEVLIKWHPSIHMPKEAARIWLKVTDVRVERLQDITPEEAVREGAKETFPPLAIDEFRDIWESTIRKTDISQYGWDANPWVWVIEFERCEKPAAGKE